MILQILKNKGGYFMKKVTKVLVVTATAVGISGMLSGCGVELLYGPVELESSESSSSTIQSEQSETESKTTSENSISESTVVESEEEIADLYGPLY